METTSLYQRIYSENFNTPHTLKSNLSADK